MDLNHLHLHVGDIERARKFYETYLEFREQVRHGRILFLRNPHGFDLALAPEAQKETFPDWFHFGFRLDSGDSVRALHGRMKSDGVTIGKPLYEDKELVSFQCADPDGHRIEIYWE